MGNMRFKVGDRVRIKSLDWYNMNKDEHGYVPCGEYDFVPHMSAFCGKILTIDVDFEDGTYLMKEDIDGYVFTNEMIEGLAEEENEKKLSDESWRYKNIFDHSQYPQSFECPEGYIFKDENGNEILTSKIILEKVNTLKIQSDNMETETHRGYYTTEEETTNKSKKLAWFSFFDSNFADKVELDLSNRELIQEDGKWFVVKKKKEYPKTYEECCEVLSIPSYYNLKYHTFEHDYHELATSNKLLLLQGKLNILGKLLICRDTYWKIAGEEMGLGKPWEPDYKNPDIDLYVIINSYNRAEKAKYGYGFPHCVFTFPTEEMRDAFYENFKEDIEICKELL